MQEKRTEIVKVQGLIRTIPSHQQLVKANRMLMGAVVFLVLLVFILGLWFIPEPDLVEDYQKINAVNMSKQGTNPVVSAEVNALKGQLIGLLSGSIESKLSSLEASVKSGTINNSLGTIEDLKNDIKVLRSYSDKSQQQKVVVSNQDLAKEVTHLKDLVYMTLASCGLMFVAAAGVWVKFRKRLPNKEIKKFLGRL